MREENHGISNQWEGEYSYLRTARQSFDNIYTDDDEYKYTIQHILTYSVGCGEGGGVAEYGTISGISRPVWPVVISQSVSLVVHDTPSVHRDGRCVFSLFKLLIKVTCEF